MASTHLLRVAARALAIVLTIGLLQACASNEMQPDGSQLGPGGTAAVPGSQRDFSVNIGDIVYFTTDSSDLTPEAEQILQRQAQWLRKYPQYTITVEGHADERGTREYNLALGARRAA
ncbi:MAG: OmpA family protein, partial [Nitrosospira sp.]|nr:OmpA family protein [Nitrosospira sp.]